MGKRRSLCRSVAYKCFDRNIYAFKYDNILHSGQKDFLSDVFDHCDDLWTFYTRDNSNGSRAEVIEVYMLYSIVDG